MTTAARVLGFAVAELGTEESPRGSNRTEYAAEANHLNGYAWCATFVVAMFRRAGMRLPSESAYTPTMARGFQDAGRWSSTPSVGAVVFYRWPSLGRIAHVGIVERVNRDGSIVAVEGNTDSAGGRSGGRVMRQLRRANVAGYGLPRYVTPPPPPAVKLPARRPLLRRGSKGAAVTELQRRLVQRGHRIAVDGDYGPATEHAVRRVQAKYGLAVDGITGPRTWEAVYR